MAEYPKKEYQKENEIHDSPDRSGNAGELVESIFNDQEDDEEDQESDQKID